MVGAAETGVGGAGDAWILLIDVPGVPRLHLSYPTIHHPSHTTNAAITMTIAASHE